MENNSKRKKYFLISSAILAAIVVFYFFGGREYYNYLMLQTSHNERDFEYFIFKYPDSRYRDKVNEMYDDFYFNDRKAYWTGKNNCEFVTFYFKKFPNARHKADAMTIYENCLYNNIEQEPGVEEAHAFLTLFPESKYRERVTTLKNNIWKWKKDKYTNKVTAENTNPAGIDFMHALMNYMKEKGRTVLFMDVQQETDLKDWDNFSENQKQLVNQLCKLSFDLEEESLPLESPPPSLKTHYTYSQDNVGMDLQRSIKEHFDATFDKDFIRLAFVKPTYVISSQKDSLKKGDIIATIRYKVSNKYLRGTRGLPSLYYTIPNETLSSGTSIRADNDTKFIMAVKIHWDITISIPETNIAYKKKLTTDAVDQFFYMDYSSPYMKIDQEYAEQFTEKVSKDLGLGIKETEYSQQFSER